MSNLGMVVRDNKVLVATDDVAMALFQYWAPKGTMEIEYQRVNQRVKYVVVAQGTAADRETMRQSLSTSQALSPWHIETILRQCETLGVEVRLIVEGGAHVFQSIRGEMKHGFVKDRTMFFSGDNDQKRKALYKYGDQFGPDLKRAVQDDIVLGHFDFVTVL
ncbi:hypothetical protein AVT69_gp329 [Pseudomonas phage PhiPA3]|uniref:Uncharacterized protein 331 n=1 Tax=Pseudomonas phage PhiPA3 TaxID=998086 RepID=F8SJG7_BPPA3|nr:hypothetical protein AVT69_gp329 [Pseudomonas phage PhiPA3]AEH03754.1 hypothetical protein [Pseudomonas phage PhiPA3]